MSVIVDADHLVKTMSSVKMAVVVIIMMTMKIVIVSVIAQIFYSLCNSLINLGEESQKNDLSFGHCPKRGLGGICLI